MAGRVTFLLTIALGASAVTSTAPSAPRETGVEHASGLASKKGATTDTSTDAPLLATLLQVHGSDRVVLDATAPSEQRFAELLADRVTGACHPVDARLLDLLRSLAEKHPASRIELVSGYRSPKLNEMLRKKGHHVASHSQHSLGHACDFRVVPQGQEAGIDPRALEREIRELGWQGGVGVYPAPDDRFVHADVGPNRSWVN